MIPATSRKCEAIAAIAATVEWGFVRRISDAPRVLGTVVTLGLAQFLIQVKGNQVVGAVDCEQSFAANLDDRNPGTGIGSNQLRLRTIDPNLKNVVAHALNAGILDPDRCEVRGECLNVDFQSIQIGEGKGATAARRYDGRLPIGRD